MWDDSRQWDGSSPQHSKNVHILHWITKKHTGRAQQILSVTIILVEVALGIWPTRVCPLLSGGYLLDGGISQMEVRSQQVNPLVPRLSPVGLSSLFSLCESGAHVSLLLLALRKDQNHSP